MTSTAASVTSSSSPSMPANAALEVGDQPGRAGDVHLGAGRRRLGRRPDAVDDVAQRVLALRVDGGDLVRGQRDQHQRGLPVLRRDQRDRHRLAGDRAGHQVVADGAQFRLGRVDRLRRQGLGERLPGRQLVGSGCAAGGLEDDEAGQLTGIVELRRGVRGLHRLGAGRQEGLLVVGLHAGQRADGRPAETGDAQPRDDDRDQPDRAEHGVAAGVGRAGVGRGFGRRGRRRSPRWCCSTRWA